MSFSFTYTGPSKNPTYAQDWLGMENQHWVKSSALSVVTNFVACQWQRFHGRPDAAASGPNGPSEAASAPRARQKWIWTIDLLRALPGGTNPVGLGRKLVTKQGSWVATQKSPEWNSPTFPLWLGQMEEKWFIKVTSRFCNSWAFESSHLLSLLTNSGLHLRSLRILQMLNHSSFPQTSTRGPQSSPTFPV